MTNAEIQYISQLYKQYNLEPNNEDLLDTLVPYLEQVATNYEFKTLCDGGSDFLLNLKNPSLYEDTFKRETIAKILRKSFSLRSLITIDDIYSMKEYSVFKDLISAF